MNRASLPLTLACLVLLFGAWWLLQSTGGKEPLAPDSIESQSPDRSPAEPEAEVSGPDQAAGVREQAEPNSPTDSGKEPDEDPELSSHGVGVRVLRADGSAARDVPIVFGDYLASTRGEEARQHFWTVTDDEGFASVPADKLVTLLQFDAPDRAYYAAAHFPYPGPPQVIAPLSLEPEAKESSLLMLRPAGAIEVELRHADASRVRDSLQIDLIRKPQIQELAAIRMRLPFRDPGGYGASAALIDGRAKFPWIGVGVDGLLVPFRRLGPTAWTLGPLHDQDVAHAELILQGELDLGMNWYFELVDPTGRPAAPQGSLMWSLEVERQGETWHRVGGPVIAQDPPKSWIAFQEVPPFLAGDRAFLRFRTLHERWNPIDVSAWMRAGDSELGTLALGPLPVQAAGRVVDPQGQGIEGLRVKIESNQAPVQSGQVGTDSDGNFLLRGEPSDVEWTLTVSENAFYLGKTLRLRLPSSQLLIELEPRLPIDDR